MDIPSRRVRMGQVVKCTFTQTTFKLQYFQAENGKDVELAEVGPRFQLRLYEIKLGTLESSSAADSEWALRPYMNTAKKRRFLSEEDGFEEDL